jgi:cephalosporin-C deacetylase-like acetyl esterase
MHLQKQFLLTVFLLAGICFVSPAQNIILKQTHEQTGVYKIGERIRVTLFLKDRITDTVSVKIWKNLGKQVIQKKVKFTGDTLVIFDGTISSPGSVIFEARTKTGFASIGSLVDPYKFKPGTKMPKDFYAYWKREKKELRDLPMKVKEVPVNGIEKGYVCYNTEINCTGPKPARGYFAKPISAKPKSLPIVLYLHAAGGMADFWVLAKPENAMRYAKMGEGALSFDLNAHGVLNGQSIAYYDSLANTVLGDYSHIGLDSKKNIYFRGMYLRLIRTLDFLTRQPEWDGKRILVIGESQGGGQALAAAGLDHRVSAVVATVPAMCDWGGTLVGRKGGWPDPYSNKHISEKKLLKVLPYFDNAHILKGCKAKLVVEIGLIDTTCPASAVFAAINQAKGKKIIYTVPYRAHHMLQPAYTAIWNKTINNPKNTFIQNYLK